MAIRDVDFIMGNDTLAQNAGELGAVVILCPTRWGVRNVAQSGIVSSLKQRGICAWVLGVDSTLGPLEAILGDGVGPMHYAPPKKPQRGKAFLDAVLRASFARRYKLSSYPIFNRWFSRDESLGLRLRRRLVDSLSLVGSKAPVFSWQIRLLDELVKRREDLDVIERQLLDLQPSLVVSTNCVSSTHEAPYILAARALGIPTLGCILSFDNLTSRGLVPAFDYYAVWNARMRDQVLRFYPESKAERVRITGTPQFDFHKREQFRWSRDKTLERIGLRNGERYILYGGNLSLYTPSEPKLVAELAQRCAATPSLREHRIVVRPHPQDESARWEEVKTHNPRIIVTKPGKPEDDPFGCEDQALLVNTLRHADVCLNVASTISLDSAVVDTPVICVAFAGRRGGEEDRFCRDVYNTEHYRPIADSGGVRLAFSMEQLVDEIVGYVHDQSRDGESRRALVNEECGVVDGLAAQRVVEMVSETVGELQQLHSKVHKFRMPDSGDNRVYESSAGISRF